MKNALLAVAWSLLLPMIGSAEATPASWLGHWTDASAGTSGALGDLTITTDRVSIAGIESWQISPTGPLGDGQLFQVTHADKTPDPLGCGPDSSVSFIAITPIAADPGIVGPEIKLLFFAGKTPPNPETVGQDRRLCETHPFAR
jgi:hypothetical protein